MIPWVVIGSLKYAASPASAQPGPQERRTYPGTPAHPRNRSADAPATPETRVVAVGDSDFAANMAIGVQGNRDFFLNSPNWLAQQENLITVRPRQPQDHRLTLTADQQNRIMILSLFIIPGLVFASGVYTWWRRR